MNNIEVNNTEINNIQINNIQVKDIQVKDIFARGELQIRALKNFDRLETEHYTPQNILHKNGYSWPGDWEGRTFLALVLLQQSTKRDAKYLKDIYTIILENLNKQGYFGDIMPPNVKNEQTISGNSWFLRGLVEYYKFSGDPSAYTAIKNMVDGLIVPCKGYYENYPTLPNQRVFEGEAMGSIVEGVCQGWITSTDIGCGFIMLDGATAAYEVYKSQALGDVIYEMIEKFFTIDLLSLSSQTHATLSALRGIVRFYETNKDEYLLTQVIKRYKLYMTQGVTENYGNYNWFNRPSWTEPCAIIDSYILSVMLWKHTLNSEYLENAHKIYYNAMGYAQRFNGGFGCDSCAGSEDEFLTVRASMFEAYWCCSMRGGEGLSAAIEYLYFTDNYLIIPMYNDSSLKQENGVDVDVKTLYPYDGKTTIVLNKTLPFKGIKLFIPSFANNVSITLNGNNTHYEIVNNFAIIESALYANDKIVLDYDLVIRKEKPINVNTIAGRELLWHGPLILGIDTDVLVNINFENGFDYLKNGCYSVKDTDYILQPINKTFLTTDDDMKKIKKQILF